MATTHIPVSGAPVLVYTPASQGVPHVTLINEGTATAYIGQAGVTLASGLPLAPRQQVSLPFCPVSLYAVSGAVATATATTLSAAIASGVTTIPAHIRGEHREREPDPDRYRQRRRGCHCHMPAAALTL